MARNAGYWAFVLLAGIVLIAALVQVNIPSFGEMMLAQVGVVVGVPPNQYNTLNDQLNQKAAQLNQEQAYINQEQAALSSSTAAADSPSGNPILWYLALAVTAVAALAVIDFYLEWRLALKIKSMFKQQGPRPPSRPPEAPPRETPPGPGSSE